MAHIWLFLTVRLRKQQLYGNSLCLAVLEKIQLNVPMKNKEKTDLVPLTVTVAVATASGGTPFVAVHEYIPELNL